MTRKKLKLEYVHNDSVRKATFKKRKRGIMKKAHELTVLCDIDVCAIIYNPYNTELDIWPPDPLSVQRVLKNYEEITEVTQTKKRSNLENDLKRQLGKTLDQYNKQRRDNKEEEILMMYNILNGQSLPNMNIDEIYDLIWIIDQNLKDVHAKFQMLGVEEASCSAKRSGVTELVEQPLLSKLEGNERE